MTKLKIDLFFQYVMDLIAGEVADRLIAGYSHCWVVSYYESLDDDPHVFLTEKSAKLYLFSSLVGETILDYLLRLKDVYENTFQESAIPIDKILELFEEEHFSNYQYQNVMEINRQVTALGPWLKNFNQRCGGRAEGKAHPCRMGMIRVKLKTFDPVDDIFQEYTIVKVPLHH